MKTKTSDWRHALRVLFGTFNSPVKVYEVLAMAALSDNGRMLVGEVQREIGVLPAQMSRTINRMMQRDKPLVTYALDSADRRRAYLALTSYGRAELEAYEDHLRRMAHKIVAAMEPTVN